jgi:hypothetical protein
MAWVPTLPFPHREGESEGLGPKKIPLKGREGGASCLTDCSGRSLGSLKEVTLGHQQTALDRAKEPLDRARYC